MTKKVFISGSISIKKLPSCVLDSLAKIQTQNLTVIVGDATGVDHLIQNYFYERQYFNVVVYSIYAQPRNLATNKFSIKKINADPSIKSEKIRQQEKDKAMTADCDYSFVIWNGKSEGSYQNIIRGFEQDKKLKVFLAEKNNFLSKKELEIENIDSIFRENNGYSGKEVIEYLNENNIHSIKNLSQFLLHKNIFEKKGNIYLPKSRHDLFISKTYRGKVTGVKFKPEFIRWLISEIENSSLNQAELL